MNFIITGSTRGIGYALAKYFLFNGHKVLINGTSQDSVDKALDTLKPLYKDNVIGIPADVCNINETEKMFSKAIDAFDKVDVLIANAGINQPHVPFSKINMEDAIKVINTNIIGMETSTAYYKYPPTLTASFPAMQSHPILT